MTRDRYFDNAATTPIDPRVLREMIPYMEEEFGNASSIHGFGQRAKQAVEEARERVAGLLQAEDPTQLIFTGGATEANNWVIASFTGGYVSPFEHSAVREPALARGYQLLQNEAEQILPPSGHAELISVMRVNNEVGTVYDPKAFRAHADALHSDLTQAAGKLPIDVSELDYASLSAHKFYGPKGIGALFLRDALPPFLAGGEQEMGARAGTLNVPGIVGMGVAAAIASDEVERDLAHASDLRQLMLDELRSVTDLRVNGGENVSPYVLSLSFYGIEGETLVIEADGAGYAISAGAACSSRSTEPSHVLTALGMDEPWLRGTVRISFGKFNTRDSASALAKILMQSTEKLRTLT